MRKVRELVGDDGEEIARFMLAVLRDEAERVYRLRAAEWLADRGWGRAPQVISGEEGEGGMQIVVRSMLAAAAAQIEVGATETQPLGLEESADA
jgi:hypothetical protein